ncbi:MAG: CcmD family protein [Anaerolineae bacterium]
MSEYLVGAYAVFWGLTFVLVFSIWMRQRRIERELEAMEARLDEGAHKKEREGART